MSLPNFQGTTFKRGDANYQIHAYQYGTSTYDPSVTGDMAPDAIIYLQPGTADSDIQLAITYAIQADVAIAVRTGGHQYSGASSTSGRNIQLDLSEAFFDFDLTSKPGYLGVRRWSRSWRRAAVAAGGRSPRRLASCGRSSRPSRTRTSTRSCTAISSPAM
jgi:hypothetical protein